MSILIKGVDLPPSCVKCWFAKDNTFNCIPRWFSEETAKKMMNGRLKDCPLVEMKVEMKKEAYWYADQAQWGVYRCTSCDYITSKKTNYCPNCGARMVEE